MSRNLRPLPSLTVRGTRERVALAAFAALLLVVTGSFFVPRGGDPDDGGLEPTTGEDYVARDTPPGPGRLTEPALAEIDRVLDASPSRVSARMTPAALADRLLRCAEFEGQRYCLGVGWTDAAPEQLRERAVTSAARARSTQVETTGDLSTADLLAQRAAMPEGERLAAERAELVAAARSVAKVVLLRHDFLGEPLPEGFLGRHPEARATTDASTDASSTMVSARTGRARVKRMRDYPRLSTVLRPRHVREQYRTYWCGPATMQMIGWGWNGDRRRQRRWARRLGTTTSGTAISAMVRATNRYTGFDRRRRAGKYVVLDISDWNFKQWLLLQMRHVEDYRAPVVLHPILLRKFFPYLDDDASGHFQVGRGYNKRRRRPAHLGYFEPWNQQRFDRSEPYIHRVQWRSAYRSYRANQAHPHQNIGV